eukprot:1238425-Prymnesium_polylepis.1
MLQTIVAALAFTAPTNKVADSKVAAVAAVAALTIAAAPAFAGEKGAGASVFNANCAACHVGGQNVILPEKNLQQDVTSAKAIECVHPGRHAHAVSLRGRTHLVALMMRESRCLAGARGVLGRWFQREGGCHAGNQRQERDARVRRPPLGRGHSERCHVRDRHRQGWLGLIPRKGSERAQRREGCS